MPARTVTIAASVGLHARPAAVFAKAAAASPVEVSIARPGEEPVDAASILSVLTLGVGHGEQVVLEADGEGAEAVLDDLASLLGRDLDAEGS